MNTIPNYVLIMASGGIDSTACVHFYKELNFDIELIFFDYGQLSRNREHSAVSSVSKHYDVPLKKIVVKQTMQLKGGFIMGRNAMFYFLALNNFEKSNGLIASGIHSGTDYYDCSSDFLDKIQEIFIKYSSNTISAAAPFIDFNKVEIKNYCDLKDVPINLTYSCELGKRQPCGTCSTCKELMHINEPKSE